MSTILCRFAVASLLVVAFEAPSYADSKLKGQYTVTVLRSCIQNSGVPTTPANTTGFGANFENLAPSGTRTTEVNGVLVFNGDGTGSFSNTTTTIRNQILNQNAQSISIGNSECAINYNIETDDSVRIEQTCTFVTAAGRGTGPFGAESGTITGAVLRGRFSNNREILFLSTYDPAIITEITYTNPNTGIINGKDYRICNRHGTGVRISTKAN